MHVPVTHLVTGTLLFDTHVLASRLQFTAGLLRRANRDEDRKIDNRPLLL